MPLTLHWDDPEHTILICQAEGAWTWEEYHQTLETMRRLARACVYRVDIINLTNRHQPKSAEASHKHYQRASKIRPPNIGLNILVSDNVLARRILELWQKLPGQQWAYDIRMVKSIDDARALIAQDRLIQPMMGY